MLAVVCMKLEVTGVIGYCLWQSDSRHTAALGQSSLFRINLISDRLLRSAVVSLRELGAPRVF